MFYLNNNLHITCLKKLIVRKEIPFYLSKKITKNTQYKFVKLILSIAYDYFDSILHNNDDNKQQIKLIIVVLEKLHKFTLALIIKIYLSLANVKIAIF